MTIIKIISCCVALLSSALIATLRGVVLDADGKPVAGVTVHIYSLDHPEIKVEPTMTGPDGKFAFTDIGAFGRYRIMSSSQERSVPVPGFDFFMADDDKGVVMDISSSTSETPITLHLHQPYGAIEGEIIDPVTGNQIKALAEISFRRVDKPWIWWRGTTSNAGTFNFLVPEYPFVAQVSEKGCEAWQPREPIVVKPGTVTHLKVPIKCSHT